MRRVIIESPFAGDRERNHAYLLDCIRDCYARGEAPIASHCIGPLVLDDAVPEQRAQGIAAGVAWIAVAGRLAVYTDLGISRGMQAAIDHAGAIGTPISFRSLPGWKQREVGA
ncbi:MAG TPA: hypothetical protein VGD74_06125 [Vulgatibacter sp.]